MPEAARRREVELLQIHRPKFNVMDTWPAARRWIGLALNGPRLELSLRTEPSAGEKVFGPFKAGSIHAYAALLRLLWAAVNQPASPHDFPAWLLGFNPPREFVVTLHHNLANSDGDNLVLCLEKFLAGKSTTFLDFLSDAPPADAAISNFQRNLLAEDLETLTNLFERVKKL